MVHSRGRLQGPRGNPGTGEISAGFMTISTRSYYRFIFYAVEGDELSFGFAGPSSRDVAGLWMAVGRERGIGVTDHSNRFNSENTRIGPHRFGFSKNHV